MRGIGSLQTPEDLFGKLGRDLKRVEADPTDSDAAFDFFVTAFHLIEWHLPGDSEEVKAQRTALRQSCGHLRIAVHIANGAKHLELQAGRWKSVEDVRARGGFWGVNYWPRNWWPKNYWSQPGLTIELTASEAENFGNRTVIDALTVARDLHTYWREHLPPAPSAPAAPRS